MDNLKLQKEDVNINIVHKNSSNSCELRIIDLINYYIEHKSIFYVLEISSTEKLELNLNEFTASPLYTAVSWTPQLNGYGKKEIQNTCSFGIAKELLKSVPVLFFLVCQNLRRSEVDKVLGVGLKNIFALRGDNVSPDQDYPHSVDLVSEIKSIDRNITVGVGGYPDKHPEAPSFESDITFLKEKISAGANFIITQICFSASSIINFIKLCRSNGITVPIVPAVFIPETYESLIAMCELCKTQLSSTDYLAYKEVKNDNDKFRALAIELGYQMIKELFENEFEPIYGIHFSTFNTFQSLNIVLQRFNFKNILR